jgi:hypothetical protein
MSRDPLIARDPATASSTAGARYSVFVPGLRFGRIIGVSVVFEIFLWRIYIVVPTNQNPR